MKRQSGFTAIELILVLAILAIMAAVAIPGWVSVLPNMRLKSAVRNLKSDLMLAQQRAIRENASVAILLSTASNSYTVFLDNGTGAGEANNWSRDASEELIRTVTMPTSVTLDLASFGTGLQPRVCFNGRGLPNEAGEVRLSNTKNIIRRIDLSVTGRAKIQISSDGGGTWGDAE